MCGEFNCGGLNGMSKISKTIPAIQNFVESVLAEQIIDVKKTNIYYLGCGVTEKYFPGNNVFYVDINQEYLEQTKESIELIYPNCTDYEFQIQECMDFKPNDKNGIAICNFSLHHMASKDEITIDDTSLKNHINYLTTNYNRILIGELDNGFTDLLGNNHPQINRTKIMKLFESTGFNINYKEICIGGIKNMTENILECTIDDIVNSTPKMIGFSDRLSNRTMMTDLFSEFGVRIYLNNHVSDSFDENAPIAYILDIQKT